MKKLLLTLIAMLSLSMGVFAQSDDAEKTKMTTDELKNLYKVQGRSWTSIHDPSVVWDPESNYFYIYGSHRGRAKTRDFKTYTSVGNIFSGLTVVPVWGGENITTTEPFKNNAVKKVTRTLNNVTEEVDFGTYDAAAWSASYASNEVDWVNGNMWAPDIIYNPHMAKWCYYLSLNGDAYSSVIILMTSDNIEGPYVYQGPIVFGGFDKSTTGVRSYKKTDLEIVLGTQSSLPSRYDLALNSFAANTSWPSRWTNPIDPCTFFDEDGELWMTYGSWFGGIFMLKLDKNTGLRDYTYTYKGVNNSSSAVTSDPYFGLKIAGGYQVSGEGSYVQHIGNYYYLFMSYGGFAPDGGYEMRVFRSSKPEGPYTDASGNTAIYDRHQVNYGPNAATNRGMKLIGAMNGWGLMTVGECAQGHNSACQDSKGRTFLVTHTKFNDGTAGHQVRAYQLYLNKQGWLCTAPFQFNNETTTDETIATTQPWTAADVEGDYHFLLHPYKLDHANFQEATPVTVHLSADGKVTGAYTGTWRYTDAGKSYIQLSLRPAGSSASLTFYYGVVVEQTLEGSTAKALCFTAVSSGGVPVWGYKLQPQYALSYNYQKNASVFSPMRNVNSNIDLYFPTVENVNLSWTSSNTDVVTNTGKYVPQTERKTGIRLTARMECGNYYWENGFTYSAQIAAAVEGDPVSSVAAYYDFDETTPVNLFNESETAQFGRSSTSSALPALVEDYSRFGTVVHQSFGAIRYNSYTRIANPLQGQTDLDGFTVSLWVKRADANAWDALWSFFNGATAAATGPRLFLTGNSYIGFNDNAGNWFDVNQPETQTVDAITPGEWHLVTFTYSKANGYQLYLDGTAYKSTDMAYAGSATAAAFDRSKVLDFVASAQYFYLGLGSFWGSADAYFDDLLIYNRELSATDVKGLNTMLNRVNSFNDGTVVGIESPEAEPAISSATSTGQTGIYDLTGRRVTAPGRGLYIIDGKKVWRK